MPRVTIDLAPPRRPITVNVPDGVTKAQARQRLLDKGQITLEDIGQQTATGGASGPFEAAMISAGQFLPELPTRVSALFGDEQARADVAEQREMMGALESEYPVSTMVGGAMQLPVPGGPVVQGLVGAGIGALENPTAPGAGATIGALGGFGGAKLGDIVSDRLAGSLTRLRGTARAKRQTLAREVGYPLTRAERAMTEPGARVAEFFDRQASTVLGQGQMRATKQAALNNSFARALGVPDANELTGDVLSTAARRYGEVFERVAKNVDEIELTQSFSDGLGRIEELATDMVPNLRAMRQLERVTDMAVAGRLSGQQYLRLRSDMAKFSRAEWKSGGDQVSGEFLDELIGVLDQALAETAPEYVAELADARSGWRLLAAVRRGAALDANGNVNPASMARSLENTYPGLDLERFAPGAIGRAQRANLAASSFPEFRSSGTAERNILTNPAGFATGLATMAFGGGSAGSLVGGSTGAEMISATADALTRFLASNDAEESDDLQTE